MENLVQHLDVGGDEQESRTVETSPFEKYNPLLHGGVTTTTGRASNKKKEVLSIAFVKKYIQYAKSRIHPVLTKGAADWIVGVYASLRNDDLASNQKKVSDLGETALGLWLTQNCWNHRRLLLLLVPSKPSSVSQRHTPKLDSLRKWTNEMPWPRRRSSVSPSSRKS